MARILILLWILFTPDWSSPQAFLFKFCNYQIKPEHHFTSAAKNSFLSIKILPCRPHPRKRVRILNTMWLPHRQNVIDTRKKRGPDLRQPSWITLAPAQEGEQCEICAWRKGKFVFSLTKSGKMMFVSAIALVSDRIGDYNIPEFKSELGWIRSS